MLSRRLADVSRSTRGVIVLISDAETAQRVLHQAKRLNMLEGHFVWLWIDTASTMNQVRQSSSSLNGTSAHQHHGPDALLEMETERRAKGERHAADQRERHTFARRQEDLTPVDRRFKRSGTTKALDVHGGPSDINHSYVNVKRSDLRSTTYRKNIEGVESSKMMHKTTATYYNNTYNNSLNSYVDRISDDEHNNYSVYIGVAEDDNDDTDDVNEEYGVKFVNSRNSVSEEAVKGPRGEGAAADGGLRLVNKRAERLWAYNKQGAPNVTVLDAFPVGLLALRPVPMKLG